MKHMHIWLLLSVSFVLLITFIQVINNLIWNLQELMPGWLATLISLLGFICSFLLIFKLSWPWFINLNDRHGKDKTSIIPQNHVEAARVNLLHIDQILKQIRNKVQIKSLYEERNRIENELERGDFLIVLFGAGSSGKTSLVRALLEKKVGRVEASMGSTVDCLNYRMHIQGLKRKLTLIDTPGIFEAGQQGQLREIKARWQASRADLVLLIVDSDLRLEEMEAIRSLKALRKRLLIVLNKSDLLTEQEENFLLARIRHRCIGLIKPVNIIAVISAIQPIHGIEPQSFQQLAQIKVLTNRMISILHNEGEELIADNILLQCQYLVEASKWLLDQQRQEDAQKIVEHYMWLGTGLSAATSIPGIDILGTAVVSAQMVIEIARIYEVTLDGQSAQSLAFSLSRTLISLGIIKSGISIIKPALAVNVSMLMMSKAVQLISIAWLTRVAGLSFIIYFQQKQNWGEGGIQDVTKYCYQMNKKELLLKHFLEVALNRVVDPLNRSTNLQLTSRSKHWRSNSRKKT
uniref:G domain-containing protein n=1 Tax=Paulinella chromatophora TaxID=39717 RepID=B1X431_PAUCH|nr:hypothetical protein PCC_0251 [Paulinella chromatophora]ACB42700.1 hypothetical protein PCC_0251 [Paulinella chromatophora]